MDSLHEIFLDFCDKTKKGSQTATDKTIRKMCLDCKICGKKLDSNAVDIAFKKHLGNSVKEMDFESFKQFIGGSLSVEYARAAGIAKDEATNQLIEKIKAGSPKMHGTTSVSNDRATQALTDVEGYTGSHKNRFDQETGKGRGLEGRVDRDDNSVMLATIREQVHMIKRTRSMTFRLLI
ncbi:Tubulin polymerization-promoting protein family member 2 [Fasciola gigantica]|uniref:Tubulin polymerization-promoting protein family member 2 n=1 Tax=Fasciola gigantica TaxID=46835 RepID=A0A504Z380_FASGI|nr:Tubulin polymerization-promoting protein family member 2 [Fasciola gigantica]